MGTILMIFIVLVLAALILLLLGSMPYLNDSSPPSIFKITKIRHLNEQGYKNYDSYMVVVNAGTRGYSNLNLYAETYRNGILLPCSISTMNGHSYIPTHHYKVQNLGGQGSCGGTWDPGELIAIDYADRTFHPGDVVTFKVYDAVSQKLISSDTVTA